jgi:hypothetical protein
MKRQPSYSTDKRLILRICKEPKKLNSKRTNNPINNGKWIEQTNSSQKKKHKWLINA